jgi:hypothetical protein
MNVGRVTLDPGDKVVDNELVETDACALTVLAGLNVTPPSRKMGSPKEEHAPRRVIRASAKNSTLARAQAGKAGSEPGAVSTDRAGRWQEVAGV